LKTFKAEFELNYFGTYGSYLTEYVRCKTLKEASQWADNFAESYFVDSGCDMHRDNTYWDVSEEASIQLVSVYEVEKINVYVYNITDGKQEKWTAKQ